MRRAISSVVWLGAHLAVLVLAMLPLLVAWPLPVGIERLDRGEAGAQDAMVRLPDDWRARGYRGDRAGYRFVFHLAQKPGQPWAVLIPSLRMRASLSVNDHPLVSDASDRSGEHARMWFRPLFYPVPASLLQSGENRLHIRLDAESGRGFLSAPLIGPHAVLAPLAGQYHLWRQTLLQTVVIAMAAVGLLMLVLWTQRRRDAIYGLYGLGMLAWAVHDLNFIVVDPPMPARYWDAFSFLALGGFILATTYFIHRYLGERRPRIEQAASWFVCLGAPLLFILPENVFRAYSDFVWHPVILSVGLYLYLRMFRAAWRQSSGTLHLLATTGSIMVLYGAHDLLIVLGRLPWGIGYLLPYSAAPSLAAFSSLLVLRFARNLDDMETLASHLDDRVKAATQEIETNHARLRDLEREHWLSRERTRLARDIHDGVGGQLVSLLARIKCGLHSPGESEAVLSQALHDLRLIVDAQDVAEGDLGTALATWRHRLERRLDGTGLRLVWNPADVDRLAGFGPSDILNMLRLLDEAATNAIRHAGATRLTVQYGTEAGVFRVSVRDDGHGGARATTQGHGMHNMRHRANALGAQIEIESGEGGTCVQVSLRIESRSVTR